MTEPISTRSLDRYGSGELSWSRPLDILTNDTAQADVALFAATKRPDGRRGIWLDGALHFTSGSGTLESLNLAANPALQCVGAPAGHRPGAEGRGSPGHRRAHLVAGGGRSLQGRLAGHRWTGTRSSRQTLGRHRNTTRGTTQVLSGEPRKLTCGDRQSRRPWLGAFGTT